MDCVAVLLWKFPKVGAPRIQISQPRPKADLFKKVAIRPNADLKIEIFPGDGDDSTHPAPSLS